MPAILVRHNLMGDLRFGDNSAGYCSIHIEIECLKMDCKVGKEHLLLHLVIALLRGPFVFGVRTQSR